jgi:hypothetical protein
LVRSVSSDRPRPATGRGVKSGFQKKTLQWEAGVSGLLRKALRGNLQGRGGSCKVKKGMVSGTLKQLDANIFYFTLL